MTNIGILAGLFCLSVTALLNLAVLVHFLLCAWHTLPHKRPVKAPTLTPAHR